MKCETCQDRGFTEENHGLLMVFCDCEAGQKKRAELGLPEVIDDINSGIGQLDSTDGSDNPSEPQQPKKPRARKKAAKRTRKIL